MSFRCHVCGEETTIDEVDDCDYFFCSECGEKNFVIGTRTMDHDQYYEAMCDSEASKRTEDALHGREDEDYFEPDTSSFRERDD